MGLSIWVAWSWLQPSDLSSLHILEFLKVCVAEIGSGRIFIESGVSISRWLFGLALSVGLAVPIGLLLSTSKTWRSLLWPYLHFFRSVSPLAWIPLAVLWFGIGNQPVIFLVFLATFFPLVFATLQACRQIPENFSSLAQELEFSFADRLQKLTLPAIAPQLITALRLMSTMAWAVLVPAEMLSGSRGLGFAIVDARNGMRMDLLFLYILIIGTLALLTDLILQQLSISLHRQLGYEDEKN
jgi:NitT/TauT family transport system permease protein